MNALALYFILTSTQFHLPPGLLSSLCYVESRHNVAAVHRKDGDGDSVGICQIKIKTSRMLGFKGTQEELMDPQTNIYYAGKYLAKQRARYHGSIVKAIISYNKGHAGELTRTEYSAKVIKRWRTASYVRK